MFKYREFPIFSKDKQRSCLLQISCDVDVVPTNEFIGTPKAIANNVHYTVYSKYTKYEFGGYNGDLKHYNYYSKASEAARKINSLLKEPGRFTHEDMKKELNNLIAPVQYKLNKETHEIRMNEFMKEFKQLILKYGLTIKPYEIDAEYHKSIIYYDINDGFSGEIMEDMIHDMMNEAIVTG